jgi:hypothetical protein
VAAGGLGLFAFLVFVAGGGLDAPTLGLVVAAAALWQALAALGRMATVLGNAGGVPLPAWQAGVPQSRLREEKRRVLRAIKELDFDHSMGKLSSDDHRRVRERYQERAVEILRALDGRADLHPAAAAALARVEGRAASAASVATDEPVIGDALGAAAAPVCGACSGANEIDARFCKHCGARLG